MQTRSLLLPLIVVGVVAQGHFCRSAAAQEEGLVHNPATGIVYRKEYKTVDQPVVETRMVDKVVTYSRPEYVTQAEPVTRTYYTPVVRYDWQPRWHGLWNPFAPNTLAYHYVPQTQWEARTETYNQLKTSTHWTAEQRVVSEPQTVTRMEKKQVEHLVAVGRMPAAAGSAGTRVASLPTSASLSPITTTIAPLSRPTIYDGMPATVLAPDPYSTRTTIARFPAAPPLFR